MTSLDVPDLYPSEPLPVRLVNTVWADRDGVHDALSTVGQLEQWARQCGVSPASGLTRHDLDRARVLRDAVRRLAADALDDTRPGAVPDLSPREALAILNDTLRSVSPELRRGPEGGFRSGWTTTGSGFDRALADIAVHAAALLDEAATRWGICHGPGCVLYFERVPARRGWCSEGCGNRARVARHYRRQKALG
jgi:predicted RNA-binding Zn ribbon-like protein